MAVSVSDRKGTRPFSGCRETQNAARLIMSGCLGGRRRKWEETWTDPVFCTEVAAFNLSRLERGGIGTGGGGSGGGVRIHI